MKACTKIIRVRDQSTETIWSLGQFQHNPKRFKIWDRTENEKSKQAVRGSLIKNSISRIPVDFLFYSLSNLACQQPENFEQLQVMEVKELQMFHKIKRTRPSRLETVQVEMSVRCP